MVLYNIRGFNKDTLNFKSLAQLSFEAHNQSKVRYRLLFHSNFRRLPDVLPTVGQLLADKLFFFPHERFHKFYSRYLKIQLEDLKDYQRALSYIGKLEFYEVQLSCKK